ncbi:beta-carotene 15,15'-monooxygenase [Sporosarcina cascadiensis]|uniref:beta-carotene 15,15'-monooxygenase n=1 Tax=Sporosarcina cascadiensis TaxID=2660747 RepID=UPI00129B9C0C|nr:beta-carotene 15,15'-monooxygenase [Sporosarcina cascadiensis]
MGLVFSSKRNTFFTVLLLFVLVSNFLIYRLPVIPGPAEAKGVVLGSIIDLAIVAPLLILAITRRKGFTFKRLITWVVLGLFASRFIVPAAYFQPFAFIPYAALGIELFIILAEVWLIILLIKHLPSILRQMKSSETSRLFVFPALVKEKVSDHPIIRILAAEFLMFYYAFATWKQKPPEKAESFTMHRNTSFIAFYMMLIHAIAIETIGIHWWLHDKSMILSLVLLLLNIYSVLYFMADIQVVRLNPLQVKSDRLQISLGLGKRMEIPFDAIQRIDWGDSAASCNLKNKEVIDFIARDFEEAFPQAVIHFNRPLPAVLFLGREKSYRAAAIRVDDLPRFRTVMDAL